MSTHNNVRCGTILEKAGRTIRDYGLILVTLWFEGTQFGRGEDHFL